ncbi:hypothetical protein [Phormidium sp. FACHB-1136]|jgi:hypothetical protein|uniref:hypothetical protein n=1 Tax=Phormidium sp. FACHB-1136 TaxID=2692848 RepID=UPI001683DE1D|nr:hypothetical protein [Phormidium sp. FACHB-1136]MBD2426200.1 hypothetical protein [Phormidium sp. FACHB-1136]
MPSLTSALALPWPLCPWFFSPQPRPQVPPSQRVAHKNPHALATLQAQAQSQDRAEASALWEVMMRPA